MRELENIMQKEMTRKEFLTTLGFGIASIFGIANILKYVMGRGNTRTGAASASYGYGSSTYGGRR